MRRLSEAGVIDRSGRVRIPMDRVRQFGRSNAGRKVVVTFEVFSSECSQEQQGYYYAYVVPAIQEAIRAQGEIKAPESIDEDLVQAYPLLLKDANGNAVRTARQMDTLQMTDFLTWLQQFAAENFDVFVEDPRTVRETAK